MKSYDFFDHTGDIGVHLRATTVGGLFEAAAAAFTAALCDPQLIHPRATDAVTLAAAELDLLLVDWLSELLYRFEARNLLVQSTDVRVWQEGGRHLLDAQVRGEDFDPNVHEIKVLIKAVTYHGLAIERTDEGWQASVIFDI